MTLTDPQVIDIVNALLDREGIRPVDRYKRLRTGHGGAASLLALSPLIDRYLTITNASQTCQVTHNHWEGPMVCDNPLPCPRHGGR